MARGFGSTFGAGTTDAILTGASFGWPPLFSCSLWIYINGLGGSNAGRVFACQTNPGIGSFQLLLSAGTPNNLQFQTSTTSTSGGWTFAAPSFGAWHHLGLTYDSSSNANSPAVFIDGAPVTVTLASSPNGTIAAAAEKYIFGNTAGGNRAYDGKLAECSFWSGVLLSAAEIAGLAKGAPPLFVRPSNLALYLPMFGASAGEPDWGSSHGVQTVTGTKGQNHAPVSFWMPPAPAMPQAGAINFSGSLAPAQTATGAAVTAGEEFPAALAGAQAADGALIYAGELAALPGRVVTGDARLSHLALADAALYRVQISESV